MDVEDLSNYAKLREDALVYYSSIDRIYCPAFKGYVVFPSESFNHIVFKTANRERDRQSQVARFKLLTRAVKLVKESTTHQEYEEILKAFVVERYGKKFVEGKRVQYWGIIAIIDNRKIKVIVRQIGEGNMHFWSIIPAWVTNKRDRKLPGMMKGNPEED